MVAGDEPSEEADAAVLAAALGDGPLSSCKVSEVERSL